MIFSISVILAAASTLLFLVLFFSSLLAQLKNCPFCLSYQKKTGLSFIDFFYCVSNLCIIYLYSDLRPVPQVAAINVGAVDVGTNSLQGNAVEWVLLLKLAGGTRQGTAHLLFQAPARIPVSSKMQADQKLGLQAAACSETPAREKLRDRWFCLLSPGSIALGVLTSCLLTTASFLLYCWGIPVSKPLWFSQPGQWGSISWVASLKVDVPYWGPNSVSQREALIWGFPLSCKPLFQG